MGGGRIYRVSDGRYIGDADLWDRFESGDWTPCCWDAETGREWVRTSRDELLLLEPVPPAVLPDELCIERKGDGIHITGPTTAVVG